MRASMVWLCLGALLFACDASERPVSEERLKQSGAPVWRRRDEVRALYSGHSLSDGVPEVVDEVARSLGRKLSFEFQSVGYSLLRERTLGSDESKPWSGYRVGKNREGEGLDIARELASPTRLPAGEHYDAVVITERHDLPEVAARGQTATYLADFARRALAANARADVFFYHTWLPIDVASPERWVAYERGIRKLWECVASSANLTLTKQQQTRRIHVLPGATALADLVDRLWRGKVTALAQLAPDKRVALLFRDNVHLSPLGTYFLGLVHYAVLYGQSPEGALPGPGIDADTSLYLQRIAARHAAEYGLVAEAATRRDMASCRAFAEQEGSALFHGLSAGRGPLAALKQKAQVWRTGRAYADPRDPDNPFRDD